MTVRTDPQWLRMQATIVKALKKQPGLSTEEVGALLGLSTLKAGQVVRGLRLQRKVILLSDTGYRGKNSVKRWALPENEATKTSVKREDLENHLCDPEHTAWMAWWRLPRDERKRRMRASGVEA